MNNIRLISQSILKDWQDYKNGKLCGSEFEAKHIKGTWNKSWGDSDAKKLGRYFEYILTNTVSNLYDETPEPEYLKTAYAKKQKDPDYVFVESDMLKPYRLAHQNAIRTKELLKKSGIIIERSQIYVEKHGRKGNIDVEANYNGEPINIDIKYSGLIYDKWSKFGWMWTDEQKHYNGIQAAHYESLNGRPTYFLVISNQNEKDIKFFKAEIDNFSMDQHLLQVDLVRNAIDLMIELGWEDYPDLIKCSACPLFNLCENKINSLQPEVIQIEFMDDF